MKPLTPDVSQKLDQGLRELAEAARSKDPTSVERAAKEKNIALLNGLVAVQLTADKVESVPALEKLITDSGGQVKTHLNVAIFASIPPGQIGKIAADPRVWNITLPNSAYPVVH